MAGETLSQKKVPARPIDVRDGRVPQRMEGIETVESSLDLPGPEGELNAALADADAGLGAEEGIPRSNPFPTSRLVGPEFPEFTHQCAGQKTSPFRPPLAISGRIRRRVRGVLSSL